MDFSAFPIRRRINKIYLHCSASDHPHHDSVAVMRKWHKAKGWRDVGYHSFVRKNGTIENGRHPKLIPSAQRGHNTGSLAICLHGLTKEKFTQPQFDSLIIICDKLDRIYPDATIHGHCEVSSKTCPVFDYKKVLGLGPQGHYKDFDTDDHEQVEETENIVFELGTLRIFDRGQEVRHLQSLLNDKLSGSIRIDEDGIFGRNTKIAVMHFQKYEGLMVDGLVGPETWEELAS